jgi:small subunit ribosomal protein S18
MISKKQKISPISLNQKIDYKDIDLITLFVTEQGKILPRRATGVTVQQQRKLAKAIKRATNVIIIFICCIKFFKLY